jgi:uncharacterized protein
VIAFAIFCRDGADGAMLRERHLEAHLAHVEANMTRYRIAGPLRDADGRPVGSLLIVSAADEADARGFIAQDPYSAAGVWAEVEIHRFAAVAGEWVGGAAWKRG